ncbi:MAG: hypothetical protein KDA60_12000, partial [Planctomycetales bacterium]|nr:hypothetical protein [Planctomycetales bacterium]
MIVSKKKAWTGVVAAIGLASLLVWLSLRLHSAQVLAGDAAENLAVCQNIAQEMERLRSAPAHATLTHHEITELALSVEESARIAGMAGNAINRITPQADRRIKDTAYIEQGNLVDLKNVTVRQLVTFLTELMARESGLRVTAIR